LAVLAFGCGTDGVLIIRVNTGTIVGPPDCGGMGGSFHLQDQGGLLLLVVIDDQTKILLTSGVSGTCHDLPDGGHAEVRGAEQGGRVSAQTVRLL
jgi:hypothetical protein